MIFLFDPRGGETPDKNELQFQGLKYVTSNKIKIVNLRLIRGRSPEIRVGFVGK